MLAARNPQIDGAATRTRGRASRTCLPGGGPYLTFTFTVKTSPDQPVVTSGPYRMLRHPGYAGGMLAIVGLGLMWGNWVSMATLTLLWLALIIWRIRYEENALLTTLDASYRAYASQHKRLVPLVW